MIRDVAGGAGEYRLGVMLLTVETGAHRSVYLPRSAPTRTETGKVSDCGSAGCGSGEQGVSRTSPAGSGFSNCSCQRVRDWLWAEGLLMDWLS